MATFRKEATTDNLLDRGKAFAAVGDTTRAEEYLTAALDQGADARQVMPLLLEVCVRTGRYRSAIQHGEDHLRKHPEDRLLYQCTKIELAARTWKYMQAYADAKTDVISSILSRAIASGPSTG